MIRINLIPPEILHRRVDERRWKWMALAAGVLAVVLVMFWAFMSLQVSASVAEVDSVQQQASMLETEASQFQVFQQVESNLLTRKDAVASAKRGAVAWARMLYELGLVLPKDVYLTAFTGADAGESGNSILSLTGMAVDKYNDSPDNGYKSVAKMLVRLADLDQLDSVWLTNTSIPAAAAGGAAPMINWTVSAKISAETSNTSSVSGN